MDEAYDDNEKVLVHHQNRIYEAKIIKTDKNKLDSKKRPLYYIHYLGWKEKWNEWIEITKILKLTEKNKELQRKVNEKANASSTTGNAATKKTKKTKEVTVSSYSDSPPHVEQEWDSDEGGDDDEDEENDQEWDSDEWYSSNANGEDGTNYRGGSSDSSNPSPRSTSSSSASSSKNSATKRKRNDSKPSNLSHVKYIDIDIPLSLKNKLVDDWNFINNEKSLVPLPKTKEPTVKQILKSIQEENSSQECKEVLNGITNYFNKALGTLLLYKFERPQYDSLLKSKKPMSDIYGAEHLLRLFVKLPDLLAISNLEEKTITQLKEVLDKVLNYLNRNSQTLFPKEYSVAPATYLKAMNAN